MTDLITRLSKLEGPDREVDAEIWLLLTPGATRKKLEVKSATNQWAPYIIDETRDETNRLITVPAYTASVDAAITLAERMLPGWTWYLGFGLRMEGDMRAIAGAYPNNHPDSCVKDDHPIPAIALCIAILRAKEASKP